MIKIVVLLMFWSIACYLFGKHQGYNEGLQDADFEMIDIGFWNSEGNYVEDLQQVDKREIKQ